VCFERPSTQLFESCKHLCVCHPCLARLRQGEGQDEETVVECLCPVCRTRGTAVAVYIV
jgi:hypothetical protein